MTYAHVWWHPNYVDYGAGLGPPRTWLQTKEQYRRPHPIHELRYYDLPTDRYQNDLYYRLPRLGLPQYRATFRDRPHTLPNYYPLDCPEGKPGGFHGRVYYEDGPPQFKYQGPKKDELYWLERNPYLPLMPDSHPLAYKRMETLSDLNAPRQTVEPGNCTSKVIRSLYEPSSAGTRHDAHTRFVRYSGEDFSKTQTVDGVGYL